MSPAHVQSTAGVPLPSGGSITITHKGALIQGKEHLFPDREFSLFIPSVYREGSAFELQLGPHRLGACLQEQ